MAKTIKLADGAENLPEIRCPVCKSMTYERDGKVNVHSKPTRLGGTFKVCPGSGRDVSRG